MSQGGFEKRESVWLLSDGAVRRRWRPGEARVHPLESQPSHQCDRRLARCFFDTEGNQAKETPRLVRGAANTVVW